MLKYLFIAAFIIHSVTIYAQPPIDSTSKRVSTDSSYRKAVALRLKTAGKELTNGANLMGLGFGLAIAGGVIVASSQGKSDGLVAGSTVSILGLLMNIIGIGKIGIAGKRLRGQYEK